MSLTSDLTESLRFFIYTTNDIVKYEINHIEKDANINMSPSVRLIIDDIFDSSIMKKYLNSIKEKDKNNKRKQCLQNEQILKQRSYNTSCFNQRVITNVHQMYSSLNEENIINNDVCSTMFDVIKSSLMHGLKIKSENYHNSGQFILSKDKSKYKIVSNSILQNKQLKRNFSVDICKFRQVNYKIIRKAPIVKHLPDILGKSNKINAQKDENLKKMFKETANKSYSIGWKSIVNNNKNKIFTTDKRIKAIGTHYDYHEFFKYYNILKQS